MSKKKTWAVYTHTSPSGKVYVGISKDLKDRWANKGAKYCSYESLLKHAIAKYGWDNLKHEVILEDRTKEEAVYAEKYLIRWYKMHKMSYNITDGGEGTSGMKFSDKRIQKARDARIANNNDVYLIIDNAFNYKVFTTIIEAADSIGADRVNMSHVLDQPIGYTCKGYYVWRHKKDEAIDIEDIKHQIISAKEERHQKASEATKARLPKLVASSKAARAEMTPEEKKAKYTSYGMQRKHHSEETKRRMSETAKDRDMSKAIEASVEARLRRAIPIIVLKDGIFISEYQNLTELCRELKLSASNVSRALKHGYRVGGYTLTYKTYKICG